MASLYDVINKNAGQLSSATAPMEDQTLRTRKLLQAKSGRSLSEATEAPISSLQEQSANAATTSGLQQVGQQAQVQAQQIGQAADQVQQQVGQQKRGIEQQRKFDTIETRLQTDQLLQNLEQGRGKLDVAKDRATKEQIAANLRLQSQEYVDNLKREGQYSRLDNEAEFRNKLLQAQFSADEDLLYTQLSNKAILDANDRAWQEKMTKMSADEAYQVYRDDVRAKKDRAVWTTVGSLTNTGINAYAQNDKDKKESRDNTKSEKGSVGA